MSDAADGFLARWSRKKAGLAEPVEVGVQGVATPAPAAQPMAVAGAMGAGPSDSVEPPAEPVALPTLADVAALTRDSDYSRFVMTGVDPGVRNAAMKKLFSDPHFNVMDGLDTYIDDYGKPDPMPLSMLRQLNQSAVLGLFADEDETATAASALPGAEAKACPDGAGPEAMAQSVLPEPLPAEPELPADDDPDLRLQPDDADRRPGPEPGPRA